MGKKTVYIPDQLYAEVHKIVQEKGLWANEAEFIREAVRKTLIKEGRGETAEQ